MRYSFGELVDKLAVIHLKIWNLEDKIGKAKDNGLSDSNIESMCDQVINLNTTRNKIVISLDELYEARNG